MKKDSHALSLDMGTSKVKASIFDLNLNLIKNTSFPSNYSSVKDFIQTIEQNLLSILKNENISVITGDGTSGTFILIDEKGNPLTDPIMYNSEDLITFKEIYNSNTFKDLIDKFELFPASPIIKLYGLLKNPNLKQKTRWIIPLTTYVLYRFVKNIGEKWDSLEVDFSNALKLGVDVTRMDWNKEIFEKLNLPLEIFPKLVKSGTFMGEAISTLAKRLNLNNAIVMQGMTDGNAQALSAGAFEEYDLAINTGSTTSIKFVTNKIKKIKGMYYHIHPISGYLASAATDSGMYYDLFLKLINYDYAKAEKLSEMVKLEDTFIFLPPGQRDPFRIPNMGSTILNLWYKSYKYDIEYMKGIFLRSILNSISFLEQYYIEIIQKTFKKINNIFISGGFANSTLLNQIRANTFNTKIYIVEENVPLGALIPAIINMYNYNLAEIKRNIKIKNKYFPQEYQIEVYHKQYLIFKYSWSKLSNFYKNYH
ncbi:MAG: FGGY-family carbohydrate kinase [Nitrososphaeria archaeon]